MGSAGGVVMAVLTLLVLTADAYRKLNGDGDEVMLFRDICRGKEKVVNFQVYLHDLRVGSATPTVYQVASASVTASSPTSFGAVNVVDDLVTAGPSINSTAVGRIQGLTTSADLAVSGVALNLNIVFTAGRYNGSSISIIGRNQVKEAQRELPVVGGTGAFRLARGYAFQTTYSYDVATSYAVMQFNIYTTYNSRFNLILNNHTTHLPSCSLLCFSCISHPNPII